jgi:hypothetical protein
VGTNLDGLDDGDFSQFFVFCLEAQGRSLGSTLVNIKYASRHTGILSVEYCTPIGDSTPLVVVTDSNLHHARGVQI